MYVHQISKLQTNQWCLRGDGKTKNTSLFFDDMSEKSNELLVTSSGHMPQNC